MNRKKIFSLKGKTVVITGGAGHLGHAMSDALAAFDANLFILGQDTEKNAKYATFLKDKYQLPICESILFNLNDDNLIQAAFQAINEQTGHIDVLINNASYGCMKPLHEYSYEEWTKGIDGTINGVFRVTRQVLPYMIKQCSGNIINIASMYGIVSPNMEIYGDSGQNNPANYGAGKAAIIQFTRYLACAYGANGIRSNTISPGPFPNHVVQKDKRFIDELINKTPMKRIGQPEDLQGLIVYLSSDASSYLNGQNIAVDGGWTAW